MRSQGGGVKGGAAWLCVAVPREAQPGKDNAPKASAQASVRVICRVYNYIDAVEEPADRRASSNRIPRYPLRTMLR